MNITKNDFNKAIEILAVDPNNEDALKIVWEYGIQEGFINYEVYKIG